jgi:hypothetical protein
MTRQAPTGFLLSVEAGAMLGERLMPELVKLLDGPAVSYGKGDRRCCWRNRARRRVCSSECSGNRCGRRSAVERR